MIVEDVEERLVYDRPTILLHWIVAGAIVFQWLLARLNLLLPRGPLRLSLWSVHVLVGVLLAVAIVARIAWRLAHGMRHAAAVSVHCALYLLMIAVVALGLAHMSGFPLFGAVRLPTWWDRPVNRRIGGLHGLMANIIVAVALLHALAALHHHYIVGNRILRRMSPMRHGRPRAGS